MAFSPKTGTDGRVRSGGAIVAGITSWDVTETAGEVNLTNFESTANADGIVYATKAVGIGTWQVDLEGIFNTDATDETEGGTPGLRNGLTVVLDLIADKTNSKGYDDATGFVSNFKRGVKIENTAFTFTMSVTGTGPFPAFGTVS